MSVEFDWGVACDADLVNAAALGDRTAFAGIYDRYADRLHDYCLGIVGDRDAADCVQEAFCVAVTDLPSLRDPDKLRPWLYAIARNQAFRTLRDRRREMTSDDLPDVAVAGGRPRDPGPAQRAHGFDRDGGGRPLRPGSRSPGPGLPARSDRGRACAGARCRRRVGEEDGAAPSRHRRKIGRRAADRTPGPLRLQPLSGARGAGG